MQERREEERVSRANVRNSLLFSGFFFPVFLLVSASLLFLLSSRA
jgi:hypothetical protein